VVEPTKVGRKLRALRRDGSVRYAEPNFLLFAANHGGTPNDPAFHVLWGLDNFGQTVNGVPGAAGADISATAAWGITTGDPSVAVGVIDTGIDYTHPDLAANIWINPGENCAGCRTDRIDNDSNGYVDDVRGWDFLNDDNDPFDDHGHGTHVAGTIGAVGNNGVGVTGVSWTTRLMPLKFLGADGSGTTADAVRALLYASDQGAVVTNNSYGGDGFSQAFADAIAYADAHNSLFVAAAGNSLADNDATPSYPASYNLPNVVTVAATDGSDRKAWFSNYGRRSVDLGAPGDTIYSTVLDGAYDYMSGTSMASPHVAGAAALVKAAFPAASDIGIKALLLRTVDPIASLAGRTTTGGRLNVDGAVRCNGAPQAWIESPAPGFVATLGQPLTVTAIAGACGEPNAVTVTASWNGELFALARRGDGLYTGRYTPTAEGPVTIAVSAAAEGAVDTRTVAGSIPMTIVPGGSPVTVTAATPGEDALLAFAAAAGQRVSLKLSSVTIGTSTCCGAKASILNPNGSTLVAPTYVGTSGAFLDAKTLPANGTYTILLDPQGTATGSAVLTLYDVPADTSATTSPGGAATNVTTTVPGQNAKITFAAAAGQRVSVKLANMTMSAWVSILSPDGSVLASPSYVGTSGGFVDTRTIPASGDYTVFVDPSGMATGSAGVTVHDVPPDATASASPGGSSVSVGTTVPGQNARVIFAGEVGQRVSVRLTGVTMTSARVSLLNPDGSPLGSTVYIGTAGGFIDAKSLSTGGTYAIVVDPQGAATGNATLTLYDVPPDAGAAIAVGGEPVPLTVSTPGQNASATFTGTAGQAITLRVASTIPLATVSIVKPDGTNLVAPTYVTTSGKTLTAQLPVGGTYTIRVNPDGAYVGTVTLTLS
jgi:hypothetical protein